MLDVMQETTKEQLAVLFSNIEAVHAMFSRPESYTQESTAGLSQQLKHDELMEIYEFMEDLNRTMSLEGQDREQALEKLTSNPRYNKHQKELRSSIKKRAKAIEKEFLSLLAAPEDKQVFRFHKEMTHLARTLLIVHTLEGFQLNVETMRKTATNSPWKINPTTKRPLPEKDLAMNVPEGSFKRAKKSWCISVPLGNSGTSINLTLRDLSQGVLEEAQNEVRIAQSYESPHIAKMAISAVFKDNKGKEKVLIISPRAQVLHNLLEENAFSNLPLTSLNEMVTGLLEGCALFNTKNVHQDLKPGNLLVTGNEKEGYKLVLTDFGLSRPLGDQDTISLTTPGYQSPEMSAFRFHHDKDPDYKHMHYIGALGHRLFHADRKHFTKEEALRLAHPDPKNDSWAVGIILFQFWYKRKPKQKDLPLIQSDRLLNALLQPRREDRVTLAEAHAIHLEQVEKLKKFSITMENILQMEKPGEMLSELKKEMRAEGFSDLQVGNLEQDLIKDNAKLLGAAAAAVAELPVKPAAARIAAIVEPVLPAHAAVAPLVIEPVVAPILDREKKKRLEVFFKEHQGYIELAYQSSLGPRAIHPKPAESLFSPGLTIEKKCEITIDFLARAIDTLERKKPGKTSIQKNTLNKLTQELSALLAAPEVAQRDSPIPAPIIIPKKAVPRLDLQQTQLLEAFFAEHQGFIELISQQSKPKPQGNVFAPDINLEEKVAITIQLLKQHSAQIQQKKGIKSSAQLSTVEKLREKLEGIVSPHDKFAASGRGPKKSPR